MTDVDAAKLPVMLTTLRLPTISRIWQEFGARADREGWGSARFLAALCEHELADRQARRIARHMAESGLPQGKSFATFDFAAVPTIRKAHVMALAEGDAWLEQGANILLFGPSGTGKSTSITQLGKKHQIETERQHPGLTGRIPVVYIIVPPAATPKTLAIELAAFLGLPVSSRDSQHAITQAVAGVLRKVGCTLVLVDEVHRQDLRTRSGAEASDQLKYFFDSVGATFVYAGLDLEENGMFSGMRGRQIAGRFISVRAAGCRRRRFPRRGAAG